MEKVTLNRDIKYTIMSRSDLDGLAAGALFMAAGLVGDVQFKHPNDMQHGRVEIPEHTIATNLPFDPRVTIAFDHHESEEERLAEVEEEARARGQLFLDANARSAARVVYKYLVENGFLEKNRFFDELVDAADKCDSADISLDEIMKPTGWVLLHYIMDARSGFGRFHEFRISNYQLMLVLMEYCASHGIDEILELPDVKERIDMYFKHEELAEEQLKRVTRVVNQTAVIDLKNEEVIYTGNRFKVYAMFPEARYSIHHIWGKDKQNTALQVGKSIVNKSGSTDVGELCAIYGGGGHAKAGSCQVDNDKAEEVIEFLVSKLV